MPPVRGGSRGQTWGWAGGRGHQYQGTWPDHELINSHEPTSQIHPAYKPHGQVTSCPSSWSLAGLWHVELGTCHTLSPPPHIYVGQLSFVEAEKPLGKKHMNLEPHTQLESFILRITGHPGDDELGGMCGSLKRICEEGRGLPRREPHLETGLGRSCGWCGSCSRLRRVCAQGRKHVRMCDTRDPGEEQTTAVPWRLPTFPAEQAETSRPWGLSGKRTCRL